MAAGHLEQRSSRRFANNDSRPHDGGRGRKTCALTRHQPAHTQSSVVQHARVVQTPGRVRFRPGVFMVCMHEQQQQQAQLHACRTKAMAVHNEQRTASATGLPTGAQAGHTNGGVGERAYALTSRRLQPAAVLLVPRHHAFEPGRCEQLLPTATMRQLGHRMIAADCNWAQVRGRRCSSGWHTTQGMVACICSWAAHKQKTRMSQVKGVCLIRP